MHTQTHTYTRTSRYPEIRGHARYEQAQAVPTMPAGRRPGSFDAWLTFNMHKNKQAHNVCVQSKDVALVLG
jgi:hypothetical protein